MKKAFIFGLNGQMGKMLTAYAADYGYTVTGGFDKTENAKIPTFDNVDKINVDFDVIIDFSAPQLLTPIITLVNAKKVPVVFGTTGYNAAELKSISILANIVPVMQSGNYSLGVAAVKTAAKTIKSILGDAFDIEIVEKHHNRKADSPSGTAVMLANALTDPENMIYARDGKRNNGEIGISSVRGGNVVGEHEIGFYGDDEIVTISHSARSRKLFAAGALKAADFLMNAKPGLYNIDHLTEYLMKQ